MIQSAQTCPPGVLDLLPWYPDEGLTSEERGVVEAHAATCRECRREILDGFHGAKLSADAPSPERVLARVFERIALGGATQGDAASTLLRVDPTLAPLPIRAAPRRETPPRLAGRRRRLRATAWAAAAAVTLAVGSLTTLAAMRLTRTATPVYETAAVQRDAAAGAQVEVILRDDVSAGQVRSVLSTLGAEIVAGPTALGRYQLRLPTGSDAAVTASALRAEGTGIATFAEPLP